MRLIADGTVERSGVSGLAARLGYSERHLNRLLTDEVGAGPLALARAQRAQTSRQLIETTDMALTDVAFAAGFGSVRQFNDTIREVFAATPTELRDAAQRRRLKSPAVDGTASPAGEVSLRLPVRQPFAGVEVLDFLCRRMIPGVETASQSHAGTTYQRTLALPGGAALVTLTAAADVGHIDTRLRLADWADLATAVQRLRRLLDLDADPVAVDDHLARHPMLAPFVARTPGRRSPCSTDPFETLVRAIVGQQISVAGARTVTGRLVAVVGERFEPTDGGENGALTHVFPAAEAVATAPDEAFSMPIARRDTIRRAAAAVASGDVELHAGVDPDQVRGRLLALKGIGPWTADYVMMRGLGHPDVFLGGDLGVVHALRALGVDKAPTAQSSAWAPWRSYATHHLWASLHGNPPVLDGPNADESSPAKATS